MATYVSRLKRAFHEVPALVEAALAARGLAPACAHQRNDHIGWTVGAKRPETRAKRLRQMLDELETGGVYMNMAHSSSRQP